MALVKFVRAWQLLGEMNGKMLAKLDLQVETADDLPSIGDEINEYIVAAGSNAQIIQSSEPTFVTLSETGTWFPEQS